MHPRYYLAFGGGVGDVIYDYLTDRRSWWLGELTETYDADIRIITSCHNSGVADVFRYHPHIRSHICEPWRPPNAEDARRFQEPIDGYLPLSAETLPDGFLGHYRKVEPALYLTNAERQQITQLLSVHPCIVVQPFAGLSDRDGFDPPAIRRFVEAVAAINAGARVVVVGHNHERGHKYTREETDFEHPQMVDLIDRAGIRLCHHLVSQCDAFVGAHSNLIRDAWNHRRRNVCVLPSPSMTDHIPKLDPKYTYGWKYPESRIFTYPFGEGVDRRFDELDCEGIAAYLLGRVG